MNENEETKVETLENQADKVTTEENVKADKTVPPQEQASQSGASDKTKDKTSADQSQMNAKFAEMRRENEKLQRRIKALESERKESFAETTLRELGLTKDDLDDNDNIALAKAYVKGVSEGVENPKEYAYETYYKESREARRATAEERQRTEKAKQEENERVAKDIDNFRRSFPNVDLAKVASKDSEFMQLYGEVPNLNGNLTTYYAKYLAVKGNNTATEADKAKGNPPYAGQPSPTTAGKLTEAEILRLPKAEFDRYINSLGKKR